MRRPRYTTGWTLETRARHTVTVLQLGQGVHPTDAGAAVRQLAGVKDVAVDAERRQLIVRHEPTPDTAREIRAALRPEPKAVLDETWIALLPKLAPLAAATLL